MINGIVHKLFCKILYRKLFYKHKRNKIKDKIKMKMERSINRTKFNNT